MYVSGGDMKHRKKDGGYTRHLKFSILAVGVAGTALLGASLLWNISQVRRNTLEQARIQARVAYEEDIVYRRWNTRHGGVYVHVSDETPPNPYLANIPERDVVTTGGVPLTLVNPAYMTRQAHEFSAGKHGVKGHLTSLFPLRPGNRPDDWEREGLIAFEKGVKEVSDVAHMGGAEYLRLIRPLLAEEKCVRCHPGQGYSPGNIRGGISVAVPMEGLRSIERGNIGTLLLAHLLLWVTGIAGLTVGGGALLRSERARSAAEVDIRKYARRLEESNRLKDFFTDIMRHDLLNPTGIINYYADFILERDVDPLTKDYGHRIKRTSLKLTSMIENASRFTHLKNAGEIECRELDLGVLLRDAADEVRDTYRKKGVDLHGPAPGRYPLTANPMIANVFGNLLTNALKYAGDGRRVELAVGDDSDRWVVEVRDFGPGVPVGDREKIFRRFERLSKEGVQGTGLGLAISKHLVELHDGKIWVDENPAGGAIFRVSLPKGGPFRSDGSEPLPVAVGEYGTA